MFDGKSEPGSGDGTLLGDKNQEIRYFGISHDNFANDLRNIRMENSLPLQNKLRQLIREKIYSTSLFRHLGVRGK